MLFSTDGQLYTGREIFKRINTRTESKLTVLHCSVLLSLHYYNFNVKNNLKGRDTYLSGLLPPAPFLVTSQQKQTGGVPVYELQHAFLVLSSSTLFTWGILLAHGFDVSPWLCFDVSADLRLSSILRSQNRHLSSRMHQISCGTLPT